MRPLIFLLVLLLMAAGCSQRPAINVPAMPENSTTYPDLGKAPELTNTTWLNSEAPLRLEGLRGKVVLLDMWTFG